VRVVLGEGGHGLERFLARIEWRLAGRRLWVDSDLERTLMFALALLASLSVDARAEAEIQFRTSTPVVVFVDGKQTALFGASRRRAGGLAEGWHEVTIRGPFGKVLYEGEVDLDDDTVTYATWESGSLRITDIDRPQPPHEPDERPEAALEEARAPDGADTGSPPNPQGGITARDSVAMPKDGPIFLQNGDQRVTVWIEDGLFVFEPAEGVEAKLSESLQPEAALSEPEASLRPGLPLAIPARN
jgi:hypothetical protein